MLLGTIYEYDMHIFVCILPSIPVKLATDTSTKGRKFNSCRNIFKDFEGLVLLCSFDSDRHIKKGQGMLDTN